MSLQYRPENPWQLFTKNMPGIIWIMLNIVYSTSIYITTEKLRFSEYTNDSIAYDTTKINLRITLKISLII